MDKIIEKINKLSLPVVILIASIILGGFIYAAQINKQNSIERQQEVELKAKTEQIVKDEAAATFNNNLKCQSLLKDLNQKFNNIAGIYYSNFNNTCIVKYTEKGETKETTIEDLTVK